MTSEAAASDVPGPRALAQGHLLDLLPRVSDKWSADILAALAEETLRFTELRRRVPGISQRMLSLSLHALERDGFVVRTVFAVIPPRVDYFLTPLGAALVEELERLAAWAEEHRSEILGARAAYDVRHEHSAQLATGAPSGVSTPALEQ
jgi:DNA-binding HxlR family transcriptional regulator